MDFSYAFSNNANNNNPTSLAGKVGKFFPNLRQKQSNLAQNGSNNVFPVSKGQRSLALPALNDSLTVQDDSNSYFNT